MTKFIIESYDKFLSSDRKAARYIFTIHDNLYAIKEYDFIDGKLMRPIRVDEDFH